MQSLKKTILSRNLDQNMLKIVLFFGKSWKNRRSVGGSAPKPPFAFSGRGICPLDPQVVIPTQFTCDFRALRRFLGNDKIKITTYFMFE